MTMQGFEFIAEFQRLGSVCELLVKFDLDAMTEHLHLAEGVAPFFEPTALGKGSVRIKEARRLLTKAKEFKAAVLEYRAGLPLVDQGMIPERASSADSSKPSQGA